MKFRSLYFIIVKEEFASRNLFILGCGLRKFLAVSSTTMESLPLKELDFGLQKPTGPSSGVVAWSNCALSRGYIFMNSNVEHIFFISGYCILRG